jgi:hypothetical protein
VILALGVADSTIGSSRVLLKPISPDVGHPEEFRRQPIGHHLADDLAALHRYQHLAVIVLEPSQGHDHLPISPRRSESE